MSRYQQVYPTTPDLSSSGVRAASVGDMMTLEYFETEPDAMPAQVFEQHHILINLNPVPHRVENWRAGVHRDFTYRQNEIVVTPAGVESGWRWHMRSKVIVVTLEPQGFEQFAMNEVGVLLGAQQLKDLPLFSDADITQAAENVYRALEEKKLGYAVLFDSLARVFLVKLIQKYAVTASDAPDDGKGLSANAYQKVLRFVQANYAQTITVAALADAVAMSAPHFSRLFKETLGRSPMQYVQAHRVEESKRLLQQARVPLVVVAHRCGFADQAHFSRVFKKHTGHTPKGYRQMLLV